VKPARARGTVIVQIDDGVGRLTLACPATRNRLDLPVVQALVDACAAIALDPDVHVVVLDGAGPDFSLGLPSDRGWLDPAWPDPVAAVAGLPQPVVAAIDGEARGWGLALTLACDVRIATTRAVLSAPDLGEGRLPGGGLTQRLPRIVGVGRTAALLLLGQRLDAREALAWGLVAEIVRPGALGRAVDATARAMAARGPIALRYAKEAVRRALDLPLDDGVRLEHDLYVLLQTTADRREGVAAFRARRRPRFRAR
jgi:enoyl-CoA hydratase/carnithine racemase